MSKSTLIITVTEVSDSGASHRTIEVPCRLPEAFNFTSRGDVFTALVDDLDLVKVEYDGAKEFVNYGSAVEVAEAILTTIKSTLGITGPVPPGSPLPAIALAYEAECSTVKAQKEAWRALPPALRSLGLVPNEADAEGATGLMSPACRMLAKYVEHVFEQAAKAVTP